MSVCDTCLAKEFCKNRCKERILEDDAKNLVNYIRNTKALIARIEKGEYIRTWRNLEYIS